jgi:hypothetical protein
MFGIDMGGAVRKRGRLSVFSMAVVVVINLLLLGLLALLAAFFNHLDVVVKDGGNDWNHIGLDYSRPDIFGSTNAYVHDALECKVPFPHAHHILTPTLLEDANQALDASIDGENVSDSC